MGVFTTHDLEQELSNLILLNNVFPIQWFVLVNYLSAISVNNKNH